MLLSTTKSKAIAGLGMVVFIVAGWIVYYKLKPVASAGPFGPQETAFIKSEDGITSVARLAIKNGNLIESISGRSRLLGRVVDNGKQGISVRSGDMDVLKCLTISPEQAICGSIRYQKSLGRFQFDRKIPFVFDELVLSPMGGSSNGSASTTGTVMFRSSDSSLWIRSKRVGTFKFLTPNRFAITWKTPGIWVNSPTKRGYALDKPMITRTAECELVNNGMYPVLCNGTALRPGYTYSAMWKFVDSADATNVAGPPPSDLRPKPESHD